MRVQVSYALKPRVNCAAICSRTIFGITRPRCLEWRVPRKKRARAGGACSSWGCGLSRVSGEDSASEQIAVLASEKSSPRFVRANDGLHGRARDCVPRSLVRLQELWRQDHGTPAREPAGKGKALSRDARNSLFHCTVEVNPRNSRASERVPSELGQRGHLWPRRHPATSGEDGESMAREPGRGDQSYAGPM